ncbi:MAG: thioredoxin [Rubrivivax sp.]|nr:MAG: thioredoxin [Rubrivivax sp.]
MTLSKDYTTNAPTREQIDATQGPLVLEFGVAWCGFCRAAQPAITSALVRHPGVPHLKVEDGPGRALGRSFRVKLWPTLVFLSDGREVARLVRPGEAQAIAEALAQIEPQEDQASSF